MKEILVFGLQVTVIGMGVVFFSLCFLWLVLISFSLTRRKKKPILNLVQSSYSEEDELLPVIISAACAAVLDEDFEIKHIALIKERRTTDSMWSFQGKLETMGQHIIQRGVDV